MPNRFSRTSLERLESCDVRLQELFHEVLKIRDITIIEGHRSPERQEELFAAGKSKLRGGQSKHNASPSKAVDVAPYPIDWDDVHQFVYLAGIVEAVAWRLGLNVRWGGNWDRDNIVVSDQNFNDLVHFEIID